MEKMIHGNTPEEKFKSLELTLKQLRRSHGLGRSLIPTQCTLISGYSDGSETRQYIGIPATLNTLELYIDDIEPDPDNKKKVASVQIQFMTAGLKRTSSAYVVKVGKSTITLNVMVEARTKLLMSFDRRVVGVWYSFILTPKLSKVQLVDINEESEVKDEGVQLPLV